MPFIRRSQNEIIKQQTKKYITEIQNEVTTLENETNESFDNDLEKNLEDKKNDKI